MKSISKFCIGKILKYSKSENYKNIILMKNNLRILSNNMRNFFIVIIMIMVQTSFAQETVCATPGSDGVQEFPAPQNSFFPGAGDNISVNAGSTSFDLEGIPDPFVVGGVLYDFGNNQISKGDLLLIIQIQDASINTSNSAAYGSGNSSNKGSGYLSLNNVGKYEYMVALNNVSAAGGELKFRASGPGGGLLYKYENKDADNNNGVKRFQVIRLMQYSDLTLTSDVVTTPWNGKAGGLIAIDVAGTLDFNGKTINASMTGFRGGYLPARTIENKQFHDYVTSIYGDNNSGSTKGEGIAGTPRYVWDGYEYVDQGATWKGYPGGDLNRGAPGNAGGGGNVHNAGGGGGGNGGAGGGGGYGWNLDNLDPQTNNQNDGASLETGGRPGVAMPSNVNNGLLFMGGGGGAGDANNSPDGARGGVGGGIVIITANKIKGNGYIITNGGKGEPGSVGNSGDGAGGGGAGGSVFINVKEPSPGASLTIQARGGNGGHSTTSTLHGPGGGGGGGIIYYNANGAQVATDVSAGAAGRINGGEPVDPNDYDDFPAGQNKLQNGSEFGKPGIVSSFAPKDLPPYLETSAFCYPELTIKKWRDQPLDSIPAGSMVTYKVQITNAGGGAKGVRVNDKLPAGFQLISATIEYDFDPGNTQTLPNMGTAENPVLGTFNLITGEGAYIEMEVEVPFATPEGTYHNGIQVGYLDPTREISDPERVIFPPTNSLPEQKTTYANGDEEVKGKNYHPDQEGEEVVVVKPELGIIKTVDNACVNPSANNIYNIKLLNPNPYTVNLLNVPVTDIIDNELEVISINGTGWDYTNTGNTYTLTLASLPPGTPEIPFESDPVYIAVKPKSNAAKSNWSNTATVPTPKGVASSSVILYQQPTQPTAEEVVFSGETCDDGIYFLKGNIPDVGIGKWEFVGPNHGAYFENPSQYDTRLLGITPGETVEVVWTITNSSCGKLSSDPLSFTAPVLSTATIAGGGELCSGAPITSSQDITITLTPTNGRKRIKYLDGAGFERMVVTGNNATSYTFTPPVAGTYTLLEVKAGGPSNAESNDWNSICPGTTNGTAQVKIVDEAPQGGVIHYSGGPVCRGETIPMALVLTGHTGVVSGWQSSLNGNTWSDIIPGTENLTSYSPVVTENIYYRAVINSPNTTCYPNAVYSAEAHLNVKDCNDLSITKSVDNDTPDVGEIITFTIVATNEREMNATEVTVYDKLPNGYTYESHTLTQGSYNENTGAWSIGNLNAGQSAELTFRVTVNQTGQYTNTAMISGKEQETDYTNNTAEITPDVNCEVRNVSPKIN